MYVTVFGKKFERGVVVCLRAPRDDDLPEFGEIVNIIVPEESKLLLVRKFHTTAYCNHYYAYSVTKLSSYCCDLCD